jgi:hypothetical protein
MDHSPITPVFPKKTKHSSHYSIIHKFMENLHPLRKICFSGISDS